MAPASVDTQPAVPPLAVSHLAVSDGLKSARISMHTPRKCQHTPRGRSTFEAGGPLGEPFLFTHSSGTYFNTRAPKPMLVRSQDLEPILTTASLKDQLSSSRDNRHRHAHKCTYRQRMPYCEASSRPRMLTTSHSSSSPAPLRRGTRRAHLQQIYGGLP